MNLDATIRSAAPDWTRAVNVMGDSETQPPENTLEAALEYMERKADEWNLPALHAQGAAAVRIATLLMLADKWQGETLHTLAAQVATKYVNATRFLLAVLNSPDEGDRCAKMFGFQDAPAMYLWLVSHKSVAASEDE